MSSEPVSDNQLDNVISFAKRSLGPTILSLMLELKSRRAQQAEPPAGCAEMANKIAVESHAEIDHVTGECDEEAIRRVAMRNISPWCSLLAELREYIDEECGLLTTVGISTDYEYQLLKRIDAALGKGDADGGREEVESEIL